MSAENPNPGHRIALFQKKEVRRALHANEWWFVITDVIAALTDSVNPSDYLKKLRKRDPSLSEAFHGGGQLVPPLGLRFETPGGPQTLQCWDTEGIFRLIQSIPSPKAEPFKRWLARVGYERVQEIENPELASKRTRAIYKAKGYSDDWIEKRMRAIAIRDELTDEWKKRGVKEQREYGILTAEISQATFGLTPSQYTALKGLGRENLRDHMNDLELRRTSPGIRGRNKKTRKVLVFSQRPLIFSMLGEAATTEIARNIDAQGFPENKQAARDGGSVAGNARRELEKKSGRKVVTRENYLGLTQAEKKAKTLEDGPSSAPKPSKKPRSRKP